MLIKLVILTLLALVLSADMLHFYKMALHSVAYDKTFGLVQHATTIAQKGIAQSRYNNFSLDASYNGIDAKDLHDPFYTFNVSAQDDLDIFNQKRYKIEALVLTLREKKALFDVQKEELFRSLVSMVALYHGVKKKYELNLALFKEQKAIYTKLSQLNALGAISAIDVLRFKNTLDSLHLKVIAQKNELQKLHKQLEIYAPKEAIPSLDTTINYTKEAFISHNPKVQTKALQAQRSLVEATALRESYIPQLSAGVGYQNNGDPTSYGNNYSFNLAVHMPLSSAHFKGAEALKVKALSEQSKMVELKLQREQDYIALTQEYKSAQEQLHLLDNNLQNYLQSKQSMKKAFLKQFVSFNSYLQVLTQTLHMQEKKIELQLQKQKVATIVNAIASGKIYE